MAGVKSDDPYWESPTEDDIEIREPEMARVKKYQIIEATMSRRPEKLFAASAELFDAAGNVTGVVRAVAKNSALQQLMSDLAQSGEDYEAHSERLAVSLLKSKGKMSPGAVKV